MDLRRAALLVVVACSIAAPSLLRAEEVRSRMAVLVDTSSDMLRTPEIRPFAGTCPAASFNPCTFSGNPTAAQESCNACVRAAIRQQGACASNWDANCRAAYGSCLNQVFGQATCSSLIDAEDSVVTRGDGSTALPGCDLDGDGVPNDSRMAIVRDSLRNLFATRPEVAFSLWGFAQVAGGQSCVNSAECPDTPGGQSVLECEDILPGIGREPRCALDADSLDGPNAAGFEGQCSILTYTGAPSNFDCSRCDSATTFDRVRCDAFELARVRTGGVSPLDNSSTVGCLPIADPTHRFQSRHGAIWTGSSCDPAGGQRLADFPPCDAGTPGCDNRAALDALLDGEEAVFGADPEIRAHGLRPLAAALRDLRGQLLADLSADLHSACRRYEVVVVTGGSETCEDRAAMVAAAGALQNLAFTNAAGIVVSDYDVPVRVLGLGLCRDTNCIARDDLNFVAAAGGTSGVVTLRNELELRLALGTFVDQAVPVEICNGLDDDCDGTIDEGAAGCPLVFRDGFEAAVAPGGTPD